MDMDNDIRTMKDRHRARAEKVVASFKDMLDEPALREISQADFNMLQLMVEEAISDELHNAAEMVEDVARQLRSISDIPESGF